MKNIVIVNYALTQTFCIILLICCCIDTAGYICSSSRKNMFHCSHVFTDLSISRIKHSVSNLQMLFTNLMCLRRNGCPVPFFSAVLCRCVNVTNVMYDHPFGMDGFRSPHNSSCDGRHDNPYRTQSPQLWACRMSSLGMANSLRDALCAMCFT